MLLSSAFEYLCTSMLKGVICLYYFILFEFMQKQFTFLIRSQPGSGWPLEKFNENVPIRSTTSAERTELLKMRTICLYILLSSSD